MTMTKRFGTVSFSAENRNSNARGLSLGDGDAFSLDSELPGRPPRLGRAKLGGQTFPFSADFLSWSDGSGALGCIDANFANLGLVFYLSQRSPKLHTMLCCGS